jgi:dihydrodipicolinate synthase/N-acetylneuraminate lyase
MPVEDEMVLDVPTAEEIAQHFKAMGDSVDLINGGQPEFMDVNEWADTVSRNKEHLEIMLAKDFWTDEDMTAVNAAIAT